MEHKNYKKLLQFEGDHSTLVGLRILNNVLTVLSLGLYYPWARASILGYMYGETEYMGTHFVFHGTGKEMFKGFLKAIAILLGLYIFLVICIFTKSTLILFLGILTFYIGAILLVPLVIHGATRYRMSRTSWRGIHFGYRGNLKEFVKLYLLNAFLTIITLGFYGSWFRVKVREYVYRHIRFGNVEFRFTGTGEALFLIRLKGIILSVLTLGIYVFWYFKELADFEFRNIQVIQNGRQINLRTTFTPGKIFEMIVLNYLIILFTLGLGTGVAINRFMRASFDNIEFDGEIDPDALVQTEEEYKDATGEDLAGLLDISIV
jgi:uncharacterized membrane protein YjgN (DUF898 family)